MASAPSTSRSWGAAPGTGLVVVLGAGLAGLAAAARLAKAGHPVQLFEVSDRLGGSWAPYPMQEHPSVLVDDAPAVLGFPAPVRDLFRKSGRTLDAELQRSGHSLVPAPPARHVFGDGTELVLPADRGEQYQAMTQAYGVAVAERWRSLLDRLDDVWQTIRPLGLEAELRDPSQLTAAARRQLRPRQSIEQLARDTGHPHLAALLRSVAYRMGSQPRRTPGWCAVELSVARRFGRWAVGGPEPGRSSVLVDALQARLTARKVTVHLRTEVNQILVDRGRAVGVLAGGDRVDAAAVISTVDPWTVYDQLLPHAAARRERRGVHRLRPALLPRVSHTLWDLTSSVVTETVRHAADNGRAVPPVTTYTRPVDTATLQTVHDYSSATSTPRAGAAWTGFGSWLRRPPVTSEVAGLFLAGPFSRGGGSPSQTVLSGALASYAAQNYLN